MQPRGDRLISLVYDKAHTFLANNISLEASAGFRFNIW